MVALKLFRFLEFPFGVCILSYSQTQQALHSLFVRTFTCLNVITVSVVSGYVIICNAHTHCVCVRFTYSFTTNTPIWFVRVGYAHLCIDNAPILCIFCR